MNRPDIIKLIGNDKRFIDDLTAFQYGYINYETLLHRIIPVLIYGKLFVEEAEEIISDNQEEIE